MTYTHNVIVNEVSYRVVFSIDWTFGLYFRDMRPKSVTVEDVYDSEGADVDCDESLYAALENAVMIDVDNDLALLARLLDEHDEDALSRQERERCF